MKKFMAVLVMLAAGGTLLAQTPAPKPGTPAKPGANADVKKTEPEPKIDGYVISRTNGTFLGLTLVEGKFRLSFYDKKKKPMALDVDRALVRWPNVHGSGDSRAILNPVDASSLQGNQFVRGPYVFRVTLTLLKDAADKDTAAETYVFQYSG
jgi:hypothetical protein